MMGEMGSPLSDSLPQVDLSESVLLVRQAQAGESRALDELLARYQDRLRRIVRVRLGARLRANLESMDIVQEAMIVAARKLEDADLSTPGATLNWLAKIAERKIHDAHDYFTAGKRDRGREAAFQLEIGGESIGWSPPGSDPSPSEVAASAEVREIVDDALTELSEDQREVILLRQYCGADWNETAAELGRSVPATQELHRRAWANLREKARPRLQGWT